MEKMTRRITTTSTWSASSDLTPVDLPREGLVTEAKVRFACTKSSAWGAASQPDALRRTIQNLKVEGDGGSTFLGLSGEQTGRVLAFLNEMELGSPLCTLLDAAEENITWVFHPGSNPKDPFDMSAAIPARALSTFQAKITTTANSVVDDTATLSSGTYYYEISQVMEVPVPSGLMVPMGSTFSWAHDANYSDFSKEIDVPAGAWLRRIIMLVQDETATRPARADDEIAGVKLNLPVAGRYALEQNWEDLKAQTARRYGFAGTINQVADDAAGNFAIPDGFAIIDLRDYFHPLYGMDLTQYRTGDVKLGLTVQNQTSGDDTILYWDQLKPVASEYVGK